MTDFNVPSEDFLVKTLDKVARFFDLASDSIKAWRRSGMPGKPGRWNLSEITLWKIRRMKSGGDDGGIRQEKTKVEIAKLQAQIQRLKHASEVDAGKLIDRTRVEAELALLLVNYRDFIMRTPDRLRPRLPIEFENQIVADIKHELRTALQEVVDRMIKIAPRAEKVSHLIQQAQDRESKKK